MALFLLVEMGVVDCKCCLFGVGVDGMGSSGASRRGSIRGKVGG